MEEGPERSQRVSVPSSSSNEPSTSPSSSSSSPVQVHDEVEEQEHDQSRNEELERQFQQQQQQHQHQHQQQQEEHSVSYHVNISLSDASTDMRDDVWSCLIVLVTFWFFASMTLILGFYGAVNLQLGPNCSRLIQTSSIFVQSIKAQEVADSKPGPMLYGFYEPPPLDVETTWSETHNATVQTSFHKEWIYYLNKGSTVEISFDVKDPSPSPLSLVIAQGRESLVEWIEDPSYPNITLSWNIIHGSGTIQQDITTSSNYYIAVGNLNYEDVEVQFNFTIRAITYNTTNAYYKCDMSNTLCTLNLYFLRSNAAVLTSPFPEQDTPDDDWYVKQSYGPRWLTYFVGSGVLTAIILFAFRQCNMFQMNSGNGTGIRAGEMGTEHTPLLSPKDDDLSSWGSSYDCISHDEEDLDDWLTVSSIEGKPLKDGENNSPRRLCVICFDSPRDCFFLPCGHCGACFTCGTRIAEEGGNCPICHRKMKKVRKIYTV